MQYLTILRYSLKNDLEPLIINKAAKALGVEIRKPTNLYRFRQTPYLTLNYDGVGLFLKPKSKKLVDPNEYREEFGSADANFKYAEEAEVKYEAPDFSWVANHHGYAPVEIKVATSTGQRKYYPEKAIYSEGRLYKDQSPWGVAPPPLTPEELLRWSVSEKAHYFGIPEYYYPQVQHEMMGCDANGGFLAVMFDVTWQMHIFYVQKDPYVQNSIMVEGLKGARAVNALSIKQGREAVMPVEPIKEGSDEVV